MPSAAGKFEPKPNTTPMAGKEQIEQLAAASPSRQAARTPAAPRGRRYKTGRNQQINIKATPEVIERLYKLADARRVPREQALNSLGAASEDQ